MRSGRGTIKEKAAKAVDILKEHKGEFATATGLVDFGRPEERPCELGVKKKTKTSPTGGEKERRKISTQTMSWILPGPELWTQPA